MSLITTSEARAALVAAGVTGPHRSHSRANILKKIDALLAGDPDGGFGLAGFEKYSASEVLRLVADVAGCSPDAAVVEGDDAIDPDRTVDAIVAAARRLRAEAGRGAVLLAATGHPTGLLEHHIRVVDAYRRAGGKVARPGEEEDLRIHHKRRLELRYNGSVGCVADWGSLRHTHLPDAMEAVLDAGTFRPDVMLADHGLAGAAIARGIPTIAVMDVNDPALAVARAEGHDVEIIPMDDNRPPHSYEASWRLFEAVLEDREV